MRPNKTDTNKRTHSQQGVGQFAVAVDVEERIVKIPPLFQRLRRWEERDDNKTIQLVSYLVEVTGLYIIPQLLMTRSMRDKSANPLPEPGHDASRYE